jgi:hypothetical protein
LSKIVFELPGTETPGYLRRLRSAIEYSKALQSDPTPETLDKLIEFLLPFVTSPEDRMQAREALWDASEAQFNDLLSAITGGGTESPLA